MGLKYRTSITKILCMSNRNRGDDDDVDDLLHSEDERGGVVVPIFERADEMAETKGDGTLPPVTARTEAVVMQALIEYLAGGAYRSVAVRAAGMNAVTFRQYLKRGKEDEELGKDTDYSRFRKCVLEAEAIAEQRMLNVWRNEAMHDWHAAASFLARRYPSRWGKQREDRRSVEESSKSDQREFVVRLVADNGESLLLGGNESNDTTERSDQGSD